MTDLNKWKLKAEEDKDHLKKKASIEAVKNVKSGYIIGLGSGSTAAHAIREIGRKIREEGVKVLGVPSSYQAMISARKYGIPLTTLFEYPSLDLNIDGADQIDEKMNLIKGQGGALTKEKIIACSSKKNIIVADYTKMTEKLGINQHVPVEILPFAEPLVSSRIRNIGGRPHLRLRKDKFGPYTTDDGNFIIDIDFGKIDDPKKTDQKLRFIPGIIETGIFADIADIIYVASKTSVRKISR